MFILIILASIAAITYLVNTNKATYKAHRNNGKTRAQSLFETV